MLTERNIGAVLIYASHFRNSETEALLKRLNNLFKWVTYPIWTKHIGDFSLSSYYAYLHGETYPMARMGFCPQVSSNSFKYTQHSCFSSFFFSVYIFETVSDSSGSEKW